MLLPPMKTTIAALFLLLPLTACGGGAPESKNLNDNEVGQELTMGRTGCERTLKEQLRDPESLQKDEYLVTEASPTSWTASLSFRAKNGFGGMNPGRAVCSFDGTMYRVVMVEGQ